MLGSSRMALCGSGGMDVNVPGSRLPLRRRPRVTVTLAGADVVVLAVRTSGRFAATLL